MKSIFYVCAIFTMFGCGRADEGEKRLRLQIIKHQPCTSKPTSSERIRFSNDTLAPLISDDDRGEGCYSISGPVTVRHSGIQGTVQLYVDSRSGPQSEPEKCKGQDPNTKCGGVGSCVYCDICQSIEQIKQKTSATVAVTQGGKPLDCEKGVSAGSYNDIRISFCMPTKKEFLDAENMDADVWNQSNDGGHMFFTTIYVFNKAINKKSSVDIKKMATDDGSEVIGCHRIVGKLLDSD